MASAAVKQSNEIRVTDSEDVREQRWTDLYCDLTGASESQARACWMHLSAEPIVEVQPVPVPLDGRLAASA